MACIRRTIFQRNMMKSTNAELLAGLFVLVCIAAALDAATPSGKTKTAGSPNKPSAKATRDELPPSKLPLHFVPHERIALVGGSLAERMNLFGNFESLLHTRFPKLELVVRNFARPCDAVDNRQRPNSY